jgi:hypothetical protein
MCRCRRLDGSALGSLRGLRSLQALKIHTLCPVSESCWPASDYSSDFLDEALHHLTGLTSLDINMQAWSSPNAGLLLPPLGLRPGSSMPFAACGLDAFTCMHIVCTTSEASA